MNSYRKRISWKAVFLLSITALEGLAIGAKAPEASSGALVQAGSFSQREPLLVSLLDGKVVAVDKDTGRQLWTFDSGPPLLSVSGTADDKQDTEDSSARSPVHSVIPSVHGKLYGYRQQGPFTRGLEELPVTIPELATMGPSWAPDGTEVLGSSSSSVFRIDAVTGQQLRGYREAGGRLTQGKQEDSRKAASALGEDEEEIFIGSAFTVGRQDFSIRSMDPVTGKERWNVTYSRLGISGSPGIPSEELLGLEVWNQGMMLGLRDPKTGVKHWESQFVMPVISAFLPSGAEISLSQAAAPPLALPAAPEGGSAGEDSENMMLVGRLGDSLFAMPAPLGHGSTGIAEPRVVEYPMNIDGCLGDEVSGSLIPMPTVAARDLWTCPLGEHPVTRPLPQESPLFLPLPETQNVTENAAARSNIPPEEDCLAPRTATGRLYCYLFHAGVIRRLIWGMLASGLLFGLTSMVGLDMWLVFNKPRLLTSVDRTHQDEGIITLKISYTGTTDETRQAREEALQNEMQSRASTPQQSSIRDHTGSGVGNNPDDHKQTKQSKQRRSQKARGPRYSNRRNGIIREEDAGDDSDGYPSQAGDSDEDADAAIDKFRRNSYSAVSASNAPEQPNGRSSQGSQGSRPGVNRVGRMEIGPEILGYGSSGTLVFEGTLDGRPIAVKRILCQFYELARKEIGALILSDEHPNIVRCFAMEEDSEFVYLALERCKQSLADLVTGDGGSVFLVDEAKHPTPFCIQLMEEAGQGVVALHQRGIVHRDIKPQNILLTDSRRAKVSDMGLCKRLAIDQSSFESRGPGGSSGWQAPEQLFSRSGEEVRQGKSVDVFSFGLVLFYCLTGGRHAFGESYERDFNIMQGRAKLQEVSHLKEAEQLLRSMLTFKPKGRPSMRAVMSHPFWWSPHQRLSFLIDMSDRMENEDREENQSLLQAFENCSRSALGTGPWMTRFDGELIENLGRYRKYNQSSLRDLLRVIRNKHNHFRELPESLQAKLGPLPRGYHSYFESRFPNLLMTAYAFGLQHCAEEPMFAKYYPPEAREPQLSLDIIAGRLPQAPVRPAVASSTTQLSLSKEERTNSAPLPVALQLPTLPEADKVVLRAQSEPDRERTPSLSSAASAAQAGPGALAGPVQSQGSSGRAQHGSPSHAQSQMSGVNGHGMARQQPGEALLHTQSRQSMSSMSHRTSSPGRHLHFPPGKAQGQNGYPPPPPQGLPPLHRSSPTASIWSSSASVTGSDWSSYVHQQQPPYWNAAQTALLHNAMAGGAHIPLQQGIMAGGPSNVSRMRGGRSTISEAGQSNGSSVQHHSPGQNGADLRHNQMQPTSLLGLQSPANNGGVQPGAPDQVNSMPARSQPGKAPSFPSRPGEPVCDFYSKTGHCRFGEGCRFDHPAHFAVQLNSAGLPLRPGEPACSHHEKTGQCKYGPACKFNHPERVC